MAEIIFKKAERKSVKIKIAVTGPSGSGKTYSALKLAAGLGKKIALLDTENESASLYAGIEGIPEFFTLVMNPPFSSSKYQLAIDSAVKAGYDVLIIDSISHQWNGVGGIMDRIDKQKLANPKLNSYTLWAKYTPEHEAFKASIVQAPIHIISTIRSKQDYVMQDNGSGKLSPQKVGMAPIQRDQFEYEFTTVFDIAMEHYASVSKDRTGLFDGQHFVIDESTGIKIIDWLASGKQPLPPPVSNDVPPKPEDKPASLSESQGPDDFPPEPPPQLEPEIPPAPVKQQEPQPKKYGTKPRNLALGKLQVTVGSLAMYPMLGKVPEAEAIKWIRNVDAWRLKPEINITPEVEENYKNVKEYWGLA